MSKVRQILTVIASTAVTTVLVLGLARLPVAAPLAAALNVSAERWLAEPFETRLQRELDHMIYQQHRPMLYHLVMLQLAEQARLTRLRIITESGTRNWDASGITPPRKQFGIGTIQANGQIVVTPSHRFEDRQQEQTDRHLLIVLVGFLFTISWVLARKA